MGGFALPRAFYGQETNFPTLSSNVSYKLLFPAISPLSFMFHGINVSYNYLLYSTESILISQ